MKDRFLLLAAVVVTLSVGALVLQGPRAALFTLLGGVLAGTLTALAARHFTRENRDSS